MFDVYFKNENHSVNCSNYDKLDNSFSEAIDSIYFNIDENVILNWNNNILLMPIYSCISELYMQIIDMISLLNEIEYNKFGNNNYDYHLLSSEFTVKLNFTLLSNNDIIVKLDWLSIKNEEDTNSGFWKQICLDKDYFINKWFYVTQRIEKIC